jgi:hypothetical protein
MPSQNPYQVAAEKLAGSEQNACFGRKNPETARSAP